MEKSKVTYLKYWSYESFLSATYDLDKNLFDVIGNYVFKPTDEWWYGFNPRYDNYEGWLFQNFFPKALDKRI